MLRALRRLLDWFLTFFSYAGVIRRHEGARMICRFFSSPAVELKSNVGALMWFDFESESPAGPQSSNWGFCANCPSVDPFFFPGQDTH